MMEMTRTSLYIIPTGDEIRNGTVLDLDSVEIMSQMLKFDPEATVTRVCPILDNEDAILTAIQEIVQQSPTLIVLIGGSGGGHRFSNTLGKDYTHSALTRYLQSSAEHTIYGKNGHMWCRLLCGSVHNTTILNVPGPFVEAKAAFAAYLKAAADGCTIEQISRAMAEAVFEQYPAGAAYPL